MELNMKKLLALVLAGVMVMGMSVTAMAAPEYLGNMKIDKTAISPEDLDAEKPVNIKIANTATDPVFCIQVDWESLDFTYTFNTGTQQWNPETHQYDAVTGMTGWDKNSAKVTITNHSNREVKAKASMDTLENNGVTFSLANNTETTLPSAENKAIDAAELKKEITISHDGSVPTTNVPGTYLVDELVVTIAHD